MLEIREVLLCPVIKVTGKEPNLGRMTKGTDQSAVKVWLLSFPVHPDKSFVINWDPKHPV